MISGKQTGTIVGHVGIEVTNLNQSKMFYKTLFQGLGFRVIRETETAVAFFNQNFSVWLVELNEPRVKRKAPTGEEFVVADHLAVLV